MATAGAVIGALRVIIGADTASLEKGLKRAQQQTNSFGASIAKIGAVAAIGFAAAVGGIAIAIKGTVKEMDRLNEISQQIGIPVEELSALKYAAELSGVSIDDLSTAMGKLAKNMVEAATNSKSGAARAFNDLGIKVIDPLTGKVKTVSQTTMELADVFVTAANDTGKTTTALDLLGKSGKQLIPFLNNGAAGIRIMMAEARQLGLVFSAETAAGADKFADTLTALGKVKNGIIIQLTASLLPLLQRFAQVLLDTANKTDVVKNTSAALEKGFVFLVRTIKLLYDNFFSLAQLFALFIAAKIGVSIVTAALAFIHMARAIGAAGIAMAIFDAIRKRALFGILLMAGGIAFLTGNLEKFTTFLGELGGKISAQLSKWDVGGKLKEMLEKAGFSLKALEEEIGKFDASGGNAAKGNKNIARTGEDAAKATDKAKKSLEDLKQAGEQTFNETRLPAEQFTIRLKELDEQLKANVISAEVYARAVSKAKNEMIKADPAAQIFENALSSALDRAIDGTGTLIEQLKALARDLAKAFASAAFKALLFGPQGGLGGTGLIGGLFGSNVAGLQHGGSFRVGGSGPADSQLVAFRATPGERVDVRTPGQQRDMAAKVDVSAPVRIVNAFDAVDFLSKALGEAGGEKVILNYVRANPSAFRAALS